MKKYDEKVINISETTSRLGGKCVTLLAIHALTGCDTVSYPLGKGKISAANLLLKSDINRDVMCNIDTPDDTIIEIGSTVLLYLYGCHLQKLTLIATDTNSSTQKENPIRLKSCYQDMKLLFHIKRAHLQILLWFAAYSNDLPNIEITKFGWEIKDKGELWPIYGPAAVAAAKSSSSCSLLIFITKSM